MMSAVPPAAKPTMMRTGLSNLSCATAAGPKPARSANSSAEALAASLVCIVPPPRRSGESGVLYLRLARDPPRQRAPLVPVLLGARARQVEYRQAVASAVHVHLRGAQVRDQWKFQC